MNSKEAAVVVGGDGLPVFWHLPMNRSSVALPDSRQLWDVLWENRRTVAGVAHSHPGSGMPGPSWTDLTTFAAIEAGLGRRLVWWITSDDQAISLVWSGPDTHQYMGVPFVAQPEWLSELRQQSYNINRGG